MEKKIELDFDLAEEAFLDRILKHSAFDKQNYDDFKGALIAYDKSIGLDSMASGSCYNRAIVKYKLKDYNGAIIDFTTSIKHNPSKILHFTTEQSLKGR